MSEAPVFVTGATGYVGGRLTPRLLEAGHRVRALVRSPGKLACRPWARHPGLELVRGDVMDAASLARAARGCRAAYWLVHSMNPRTSDYAAADRRAALNMATAGEAAGLGQIIYLGGLVPDDPAISHHLRSRAEVGRILMEAGPPATWLRAAMILGSGSASFELLRYLADRLPVMLTPRWVRTPVQPIGIDNVLGYLLGVLDRPQAQGRAFDIGGPEVTTYAGLFQLYARLAGLRRRLIIPVPLLSPRLSSLWIHLVTPVPAALARPLAEGLRNKVVMREHAIEEVVPQRLMTCAEVMGLALQRVKQQAVETCWHDAGQAVPPEWVQCGDAPYAGGTVLASAYRARLAASAQALWPVVAGLGGQGGWLFGDWLWRLRGWLDRLAGGPWLARGRRGAGQIGQGDALDFWRVLAAEPPRRLTLLAEMKLPGEAVLELRLEPRGPGQTEAQVIMRFLPRGLAGLAYWKLVEPLHDRVGQGLLHGLARAAGAALTAGPEPYAPGPPQACQI